MILFYRDGEDLLELIAGMQSKRMDEQRVTLPSLPGVNTNQDSDDSFIEMLVKCQVYMQRQSLHYFQIKGYLRTKRREIIMYFLSELAFRGSKKSFAGCVNIAGCRRREEPKGQWRCSIGLNYARGRSFCPDSKTASRTDGGSKGFRSRQGVLG